MKRWLITVGLVLMPGISYADVASTEYADAAVVGKQDKLTAGSGITINGNTINTKTYDIANATTSGITKLYTDTGTATDGTMTQNAITNALSNLQETLPMATRPTGGEHVFVWDGNNNRFVFKCNRGYSGDTCSCTTPCTSVANRTSTIGTETCTITNGTGSRSYTNTCSGYYTNSACSSAGDTCSGCSAYNTSSTTGTCYVASCNTGYYGTANSSTKCTACTNKPTNNSSYTGSATSNACPWSCSSGYYAIGFTGDCVNASTAGTATGVYDFTGWTSNATTYNLTTPGSWAVNFSYGTVKGIATCNTTSGTQYSATTTSFSQISTGSYCWCKMTSPKTSKWVYLGYYSTTGSQPCDDYCAYNCANRGKDTTNLRKGLYGSI